MRQLVGVHPRQALAPSLGEASGRGLSDPATRGGGDAHIDRRYRRRSARA